MWFFFQNYLFNINELIRMHICMILMLHSSRRIHGFCFCGIKMQRRWQISSIGQWIELILLLFSLQFWSIYIDILFFLYYWIKRMCLFIILMLHWSTQSLRYSAVWYYWTRRMCFLSSKFAFASSIWLNFPLGSLYFEQTHNSMSETDRMWFDWSNFYFSLSLSCYYWIEGMHIFIILMAHW